jgi:hypothetical protein
MQADEPGIPGRKVTINSEVGLVATTLMIEVLRILP